VFKSTISNQLDNFRETMINIENDSKLIKVTKLKMIGSGA
jgi:hypothetical protein